MPSPSDLDWTDLGWAPPDAGWPRARTAASGLEWVWAVGLSSLAHAAAYAALAHWGWGAAMQSWPASPGPSSIQLTLSLASTPSPESGEPAETSAVEVTVTGEAAPRGSEHAHEAQAGAIERRPARLATRSVDEASPEPPAPDLALAQGARAEAGRRQPEGGAPKPASATSSRQAAQPRPAASASLPQTASLAAQGVDALPQAIQNPAPVYPPDLLAARVEGRVVLRVLVRADGTVGDASVHVSSGRRAFDDAALATIRRWRFTPAMRHGAPVEHSIAAPIRFVIGPAP